MTSGAPGFRVGGNDFPELTAACPSHSTDLPRAYT